MECKTNTCEPQSKSCSSKIECSSSGCQMTDKMLKMAEEAWGMAMKEKMKKQFENVAAEKLDKMATSVVQASMTYWQNKMKSKGDMHKEFENIKQAMMI